MTRKSDIDALLEVADDQLALIQAEYEKSLNAKSISPKLTVYIKNLLENLRSPLDYLAKEICENVLSLKGSHTSYFPLSSKDNKDFAARMTNDFPGLHAKNPPLHALLESFQPYSPTGCKALAALSKLVNENKHNQLSPQTRIEQESLTIEFPGGAGIVLGPGAGISGGGTISSGGGWISPAGGTISGENPVRAGSGFRQTVTKWVSFRFSATNDDVTELLRTCREDVARVITEVKPFLWP